jgi:MFS family permease
MRKDGRAPIEGTAAQGVLLCLLSTLNIAAALAIAPVLPAMTKAFAADPNVAAKVLGVQALPAFIVALTAYVWGRVADVTGRKRLLLLSLLLYLFCGLAPFFLHSLNVILISRIGVGLAESGFMTVSTALIGDYFKGKRREHWLVVQTSTASISAIFLTLAGGALGNFGWRFPFVIYALPLIFLPLVLVMIREPVHEPHDKAQGFPWGRVMPLYALAFVAALFFMIPPIQTPFILTGRGVTAPQSIGMISAAAALAVPLGGVLFRITGRLKLGWILSFAFALIGAGLMLIVTTTALFQTVAGIVVMSLGCGLILPAVLTAIMAHLSFRFRGQGTGGWQTFFFLGQSLSPVLILTLNGRFGGLDHALRLVGAGAVLCLFLSLIGAIIGAGDKATA